MAVDASGCAAPDQAAPVPASVDLTKESVIAGRVLAGANGEPVAGGYVRLLDASGEFAAEVVSSPAGQFRFFAAPGTWTVRALAREGSGDVQVTIDRGVTSVDVIVA